MCGAFAYSLDKWTTWQAISRTCLTHTFLGRRTVVGRAAAVLLWWDGVAVGPGRLRTVRVYNADLAVLALPHAAVWGGPGGVVRPGDAVRVHTRCRKKESSGVKQKVRPLLGNMEGSNKWL